MGIGKQVRRVAAGMLCVMLALGMMPARALGTHPAFDADGVGTDSTGATQMADTVSVSGGAATSNVYVEVAEDTFEVTGRSPDQVAADVAGILAFYDGRIWVQTQGGTTPITGSWQVTRDGEPYATFTSTQALDGTWGLDLTTDGAAGTLKVEAEHEYACTFKATDAQGRVVTACVTFLIQRDSPYGAKTIYPDHEETFDGVATYAEPSATGIIHKYVQHLAATKAEPASAVYQALMEQAAALLKVEGQEGAYAILTAWDLEARFAFPQTDAADPYKGYLSVVIPLPDTPDTPQAGETVTLIGYDSEGAKEVREVRVRADESGTRYISFDDACLGAYAVCTYIPKGATAPTDPDDPNKPADPLTLTVTGIVEGQGFMNYAGTYTWPKIGCVRYTFTPVVPGAALSKVEVEADGTPLEVPAWCRIAGYYDLDLEGLPEGTHEVTIRATFVDTGGSATDPDVPVIDPEDPTRPVDPTDPDDPMNKDWSLTVVTEGTGSVDVSIEGEKAQAPYTFRKGDTIGILGIPDPQTGSVLSATLACTIGGQVVDIPLNLIEGACSFQGPGSDATVHIVFSTEAAPSVPAHTATVRIEGGHGFVDADTQTEATKPVSASVPATFTLFADAGYVLYTIFEGDVEVSAYATSTTRGTYTLTVPDVGRDRILIVRFIADTEELPPVVIPGTFVTIDVVAEGAAGLDVSLLPTITPPSVSIPKGGSYSFYAIPSERGGAELAYVRAKSDLDATWRDITSQASWVMWPEGTTTGYWLLKLDGVSADTHVRIGFKPTVDGEDPRLPTKTRNITINVIGSEWGAVFPNTVGKPALKVPVGKSIVVTVVTREGYHYEVRRADETRAQASTSDVATSTSDITFVAPTADDGTGDTTSTEVIGGAGDTDEDWEFVFGPLGGGDSSSSSSSAGSSSGSSAGSSSGSSAGSSGSNSQGSSSGGQTGSTGTIADPSGRPSVTPVVVADASGRTHGRIVPASTFLVARGATTTLSFIPDTGYKVARVEVNGSTTRNYTQTGITLRDIQRDTTVRVTFAATAETDSLTGLVRTVHRLQSLAKTGDVTPPAITCLLGVACAAAGVAFLLASRRRRDEEEVAAGE